MNVLSRRLHHLNKSTSKNLNFGLLPIFGKKNFTTSSKLFNNHETTTTGIKSDKDNFSILSIDTSGLVQETYDSTIVKEHETPMVKHLKNKIKGAGPISVSTFIQETLLNPI